MNMKFGETEQIILNRQINIIYKNFESKVKISQFFFQHEIPTEQQVRRSDAFNPPTPTHFYMMRLLFYFSSY